MVASCHQRVTRKSQNVMIHLHLLVDIRITYKNINIFYIDPLSDMRPDLKVFGCRDFDYVTSFTKIQILLCSWDNYIQSIQLARFGCSWPDLPEWGSNFFDRSFVNYKILINTAVCTFAQYQYISVYICSVQLRVHYLPNTSKDVYTFARYSCA